MELALPHAKTDARGWRRVFSIASAPGADRVRFAIRMPERTSSFKAAMLELEPGTVVTGTSVSGDFVLPKDAAKPLLLVAAGIGITPFISQLEHLTATGEKRDIVAAVLRAHSRRRRVHRGADGRSLPGRHPVADAALPSCRPDGHGVATTS